MPSLKELENSDFGAKLFPTVDVETFIQSKGIEYFKQGKWLRMKCILPFGHDDSNPSFFIHSEHGGYNCYVCGSGNWSDLCQHMNWNIAIDTLDVESIPDALWKDSVNRIKQLEQEEKKEKVFHKPHGFRKIDLVDEHCHNHLEYLRNRNLLNAINVFEIGYTIQKDNEYGSEYLKRVIIPCHNKEGKYIWSEGRMITNVKTDRKYYRPYGVEKIKYLFNIHRVLQQGYNHVIVVEGIMDAINLWLWKFPVVCCFGANIAEEQIKQLMIFDTVVLCLDNDTAGIKGHIEASKKLVNTGTNLFRAILPKGQDVNNISLDRWNKIYSKITSVTKQDVMRYEKKKMFIKKTTE